MTESTQTSTSGAVTSGSSGGGDQEILFLGFNQDRGCFSVGTSRGFKIYNTDPVKERFKRDFEMSIGIVEMLYRCNIIALVGGGKNPRFPSNKVMIWDDFQSKCIAELEFRSEVKGVRLRRERIVVILKNKVYVYNFSDLNLLHQLETADNPQGLCALSSGEHIIIACPGYKVGQVHVEYLQGRHTQIIMAHHGPLQHISLSQDGSRLATASEKGTLIRVYDTTTGMKLKELRRGADRADIYCISFSSDSALLVVTSNKGTCHVYGLPGKDKPEQQNKQSSLKFMREILPSYFSSEWSFAKFIIPEVPSICCFGKDPGSVVVVAKDGSYYKFVYEIDKNGECRCRQDCSFQILSKIRAP